MHPNAHAVGNHDRRRITHDVGIEDFEGTMHSTAIARRQVPNGPDQRFVKLRADKTRGQFRPAGRNGRLEVTEVVSDVGQDVGERR